MKKAEIIERLQVIENILAIKEMHDCSHEWLRLQDGGAICSLCVQRSVSLEYTGGTREKIEVPIRQARSYGGTKERLLDAVGCLWDDLCE